MYWQAVQISCDSILTVDEMIQLELSTIYFDGYSKVGQERLGLCKEKRGKRVKDYSGES